MSILSHYKDKDMLPPGLASLFTSRTIILVAFGFTGLFLPIFLIQQYGSLEKMILFYLFTWLAYLFFVAPGAKIMNVIGIRLSLSLSLPFLASFYLALYFFETDILIWTIVAGLSLTVYRMLFWVPYHTDFAKFSEGKNRGKQIGLLDSISTFFGVIIPVVSGFLIKEFGFKIVFVIVIILILMAIVPLRFLPIVKEKFTWPYLRVWKEYFSKKNRKMMVAYMADGAENWIGAVLWPVFIWQLLNGQYLAVGAITSVITLVAVILKLIVGDYTDRFNKRKMMRIGSIFYSIGWLVKIFITTSVQIFFASTYHNFAMILLKTPWNALVYEKTSDSGHYVDEYSALKEMFQQTGRVFVMVVILVLLQYLPLNLIFILAALASLLVNLLPKQGLHEETGTK